MSENLFALVNSLGEFGWSIVPSEKVNNSIFPNNISMRYPNLPKDLMKLIHAFESIVSSSDTAWFLCSQDYAGISDSDYRWNEWEMMSLEEAGNDVEWKKEIRSFWDEHFPFLLSVKSGYAFFAIRMSDQFVVRGEEPEFEEVTEVAPSFIEFLKLISNEPGQFMRYL